MDKISTPKSIISVNKKNKAIKGPKESTLDFLRTFARFYTPDKLGDYTKAAVLN